jgi:hypothetical protein
MGTFKQRAESIRQEAKIPDSDEALRQHMQEETAQELGCQQCHLALLATTRIVLPTEGDAFSVECQQPVIGNGDPVRVSTEIAQDLGWATEGRLGVDQPVLTVQLSQKSTEVFWISPRGGWSSAAQVFAAMEPLQTGEELAAEYAAKDLHRQEERIAGPYPAAMVRRQSARWNGAVNVRMEPSAPTIP